MFLTKEDVDATNIPQHLLNVYCEVCTIRLHIQMATEFKQHGESPEVNPRRSKFGYEKMVAREEIIVKKNCSNEH